ncbi:MAG: hypothetical protein KKD44_17175, partial [Proteobacteria bacterium]|nr:hypothetical protein [Pseudomonadota bacterium]
MLRLYLNSDSAIRDFHPISLCPCGRAQIANRSKKSSALWHGVTNIISIFSAKIPNYMIDKIICI